MTLRPLLPLLLCLACGGDKDSPAGGSGEEGGGSDTGPSGDAGGDSAAPPAPDEDGDGYSADEDCDDSDPQIHPGADEYCDGVNTDCDGAVDEVEALDATTWYRDVDLDGYGDPSTAVQSCVQPIGYISQAEDCDDSSAAAAPGLEELCNDGLDNNCNGDERECLLGGELSLADAETLIEGSGSGDRVGAALLGGADLNGDGAGDLLIGSTTADGRGADSGSVWALWGPLATGELALSAEADLLITGASAGHGAGGALGAADCNGDGHLDLLITALHANGGGNDSGEAYLVLGPLESMDLSTADLRMIGEYSYDQAGYHGQIAGDLTGDGLPDLLVGATGFGESATQAQGATYVVAGSSTGSLDLSAATARAIGTNRYDRLGYTHAGAADLDGDGVAELVVGAPTWPENAGQGAVYIWEGPLSGELDPEDAPGRLEGEEEGDQAGSAVIAADLDGDGSSELIIGAPARDAVEDTEGQVYLWSGAVSGPTSLSGAASTLLGSAERQAIGSALSAGDLDADGLDDLMLGASSADLSATDAGAAWVWYSPVVAGSSTVAEASITLLGASSRDSAGAGVALAGDLSGDWIPDLVVGASLRDGAAADSGVIFVMQGRDL